MSGSESDVWGLCDGGVSAIECGWWVVSRGEDAVALRGLEEVDNVDRGSHTKGESKNDKC